MQLFMPTEPLNQLHINSKEKCLRINSWEEYGDSREIKKE